MNDQNRQRNNNNQVRFNNPYNLDPTREDISIEKKINRDFFCPLLALTSQFSLENDYYSIRTVDPLKEFVSFYGSISISERNSISNFIDFMLYYNCSLYNSFIFWN